MILLLFLFTLYSTRLTGAAMVNQCNHLSRDVLFILDGSKSIDQEDFEKGKEFIIQMMDFVINSHPENRVALMIFGDEPNIIFDFNKHKTLNDMRKDVQATKNDMGFTAIGQALNVTWTNLYPIMRKDSEKLVIMLTDGSNNKFPVPYIYAEYLKNNSVLIITIGIGEEIDRAELKKIASPELATEAKTFGDLYNSLSQFQSRLCPIPDPMPPVPCETPQHDFVILLDSSESIEENDYEIAKKFVIQLIKSFDIYKDKVRVAMMSFSDSIRIDFMFNLTDVQEIVKKVNSLEKFGSLTGIGLALQAVSKTILPERREQVPFNVLLVTDGQNNMYPNTRLVVPAMKKEGVNFLSLGVGEDVDVNELKAISSGGQVYTVGNYQELLKSISSIIKMVECGY